MPARIRCFLLTPTEHVVVELRRYSTRTLCGRREARYPGADATTFDVHDVHVEIGREEGTLEPDISGSSTSSTLVPDDPRWPARCSCGYVFDDADARQEWRPRLYQRSDTGELVTIHAAPVGALYDHGDPGHPRLVCKTPAGEWLIDHPVHGWTRTGTPPDIIVQPSIRIGQPQTMHGWLGGFNGKGDEPGWLCIDFP